MFTDEATTQKNFTIVTSTIHQTIKENALYYLISDILAVTNKSSSNNLLSKYIVKPFNNVITGREAFTVRLKNNPDRALLEIPGYELINRHLTVDKFFANASSTEYKSFSACHYTAVYKVAGANKKIICHQYIDVSGNLISCEAKLIENDSAASCKFTAEQIKLLQKDARSSQEIVKNLEHEKISRYKQALEQASNIELKLGGLFNEILKDKKKPDIDAYLKYAEEFKQQIMLLNSYNSQETDRRAEHIIAVCDRIKQKPATKQYKHIKSTKKISNVVVDNQDSEADKTEPQVHLKVDPRKEQLVSDAKKLIAEIKEKASKLIKVTSSLDIQQLVEQHEIVAVLRLQLVELAFLPKGLQNNRLLNRVQYKVQQVPSLLEKFEQEINAYSLENVVKLFPYVKNENLTPVFFTLAMKLVASEGEQRTKIGAMCNFFYETSFFYKAFMVHCLGSLIYQKYDNTGCSVIMEAFRNDNLPAFKLLLQHGVSPNSLGLKYHNKFLSILHSIAYFHYAVSTFESVEYINTLLAHGALIVNDVAVTICKGVKLTDSSLFRHVKSSEKHLFDKRHLRNINRKARNAKNSINMENAELEPEIEYKIEPGLEEIFACDSALLALCLGAPKPNLINLLIPGNNLVNLATAVSMLTDNPCISTLFLPLAVSPSLMCLENSEMAREHAGYLATLDNSDCPHMIQIFVNNKDDPFSVELFASLQNTIQALSEKYAAMEKTNPAQITAIISSLMRKILETDNDMEKLKLYTVVNVLLTLKSEPRNDSRQLMVKCFCEIGKIFFDKRGVNSDYMLEALEVFHIAKNICEYSTSANFLRTTPLYPYVKKMLAKVDKEEYSKKNQGMLMQFADYKQEYKQQMAHSSDVAKTSRIIKKTAAARME